MKTKSLLLSSLLIASVAQGAIVAQWNFNGGSTTTVPGGSSAPTPSVGAGVASLSGSATATFASGISQGGSSDPVITSPNNFGWNTSTYGAISSAELVNGPRFNVSTVGLTDVKVSFDLRFSNTSSRHGALQYTTDGAAWTTARFFSTTAGDTWVNNITFDFTSIPVVNNNSAFGIRMVNAHELTATGTGAAAFVAASTTATYGTGGTWRFDMVTVDAIPEPSTALLGAIGALALLRRRR